MAELGDTVKDVIDEYIAASDMFPPFNSPHEGYAVILEELDELWEEIKSKKGTPESMRAEAIQVAAMAIRFIIDCTRTPYNGNQTMDTGK